MEIQLIFTQNNRLKIQIINNQYVHGDFKICFSLVYSIQDISGANIFKKVGRYYEIHSQEDEIFLTLQEPRIGSYNLSCGPEGLFVIDKNDNNVECKIIPLKFENPIEPTLIFVAVLTMGLGITFISTFFATQRYLNLKSDSVY